MPRTGGIWSQLTNEFAGENSDITNAQGRERRLKVIDCPQRHSIKSETVKMRYVQDVQLLMRMAGEYVRRKAL